MSKGLMFWVRIVAVIAAIALPAYVSYVKKHEPPAAPTPLACTANAECEVRGKDEHERCHHVKDPPSPEENTGHDATSKTHDGFACMCIAHACSWADKEYQACVNTGGNYSRREDCPVCPPNAVCEACFVGCQCPAGKTYDKSKGCG